MGFREDLKLEDDFYNLVFKPWLISRGNDSIFIRYESKNSIYSVLQRRYDIDVIVDTGRENIALSLKTVRRVRNDIFFETVSNCNTNSPGWGIYSKADWIVYSMGDFDNGFISWAFKLSSIPPVIDKYPKKYGRTWDNKGRLLYKTEGYIIPLADFKHELLFDTRVEQKQMEEAKHV